jgi:tetratricopeptide (TPR) repeat protein
MKKQVILAGLLFLTAITFGQKKEIKKAEKEIKSGNFTEAMTLLDQAEGMLDGADADLKSQFYIVKARGLMESSGTDSAKLQMAADLLAKAREVDSGNSNSSAINDESLVLKGVLENNAGLDYKDKRYKQAAEKFYLAYSISPKDTLFLFNAALSSKFGEDLDNSSIYFQSLADLGYTGKQKQYVATDKATGVEEAYVTKSQRDLMVKLGTHIKPEEKISESKRELVLLSLAQIYLDKGDSEKALGIIAELRKENPKDVNLIQVEADMVYKQGNMERYNDLMKELIAVDPNNPDLYNNLGVANAKLGLKDKAIEYYNKAIELNPDNSGAQINIAVLILAEEGALNEEMNALGTSKADYAKYDELKEQKNNIYRQAMPYLESALKTRTDNIDIVRTLMGIYSQLGMDDKFKAMKLRLQEMEGGQ